MARADREGLCGGAVPRESGSRRAGTAGQPGLAPTQRATIFWRRANDGRSEAAGFYAYQYPGDQFDERDDACEMDAPKLVALYVRPEFRGQGIGAELLRDSPPARTSAGGEARGHRGCHGRGFEAARPAVPADERKRFLEYRGDEFVRSLRLALERRDRVASHTRRLERHVRRAARTPALEPGPDAAAAAAGLLLVAGWQLRADPEGPDGCRSSDTVPATGPDDDDSRARPGPGRRRGRRRRRGEPSS